MTLLPDCNFLERKMFPDERLSLLRGGWPWWTGHWTELWRMNRDVGRRFRTGEKPWAEAWRSRTVLIWGHCKWCGRAGTESGAGGSRRIGLQRPAGPSLDCASVLSLALRCLWKKHALHCGLKLLAAWLHSRHERPVPLKSQGIRGFWFRISRAGALKGLSTDQQHQHILGTC